ncbi:urease accessory protein [Mangrovactinospora gilvigrisea]|uniref:Urease accessory protein UreF n=1 Tax=Mangrovactinospora gilvigrisea TaxID=1428644 RepID=A0A1J7C6K1_9ACTN|nr:urease accessory UreF family protein [Mangrovactinospora gilvigrisea]OIV37164.1 urease accessory protein [Mangrovactinospora gilvigrisea]
MSGVDELLAVLQLTDSAFPSGMYTLSHSLEGYQQARAVTPATLPALLAGILSAGAGPSDATAVALAHRACTAGDWPAVAAVDRRLHATKLGREARQATVRTGRQLLDLTREIHRTPELETLAGLDGVRPCRPVVAAVAHAALGVPVEHAVAAELFGLAASLAGAALRLRLTDHRRAQLLLRRLAPAIERATADALARDLADLGGCTPLADLMGARHERAEARLFAS